MPTCFKAAWPSRTALTRIIFGAVSCRTLRQNCMTLFQNVSRPATGGRTGAPAGRYGVALIVGIIITAAFVGYFLRDTLGTAEIFEDRAASPAPSVPCATVVTTRTDLDSELKPANSVAASRPPPSSQNSYLTRQAASARLYTNEGHALDAYRALDPQLLAPGTYAMQAWLWEHQHPADCAQARFMVFHDFASGIGSQVHVMTHHALCAFREGRVMLWGRRIGIQYTDEKTCGRGVESWLCHLRPPSSCTLEQASLAAERKGADTVTVYDTNCPGWDQPGDPAYSVDPDGHEATFTARVVERLPPVVHEILGAAGLTAYFFHFNDETIAELGRLRLKAPRLRVTYGPSTNGSLAWPNLTGASPPLLAFPLPPGVISAHVRHGDKSQEMRLVEFPRYLRAARVMEDTHPFQVRRAIFVSTENPLVIKQAADPGVLGPGWSSLSYTMPRFNEGAASQIRWMGPKGLPAGRLTRLHLLQLLMALECDAWVGTRASNWNRLVDELRGIWVPKADLPYVEVGYEPDVTLGW